MPDLLLQVFPTAIHRDSLGCPQGTYLCRDLSLPPSYGIPESILISDSTLFAMDPSRFPSNDEQHLSHSSLGYGYPQSTLSRPSLPRRHAPQDDQFYDQVYLQLPPAHDRQWALSSSAHASPHPHSAAAWSAMSASVPSISSHAHHHVHSHGSSNLPDLHPQSSSIHSAPSPVSTERVCPPLRQRAQRTGQACENCRGRKTKCSGTRPVCERCATRGLPCRYPESKAQARRREAAVNDAPAASTTPTASASAPNLSPNHDVRTSPRPTATSEPATAMDTGSALAASSYLSPPLSILSPTQNAIRYHYTSSTSSLSSPLESSDSTGTSVSGSHWSSQMLGYNSPVSADEISPSGDSNSSFDNFSYLAAGHTSERSSLSSPHDQSPSPQGSVCNLPVDAQQPSTRASSLMPYAHGQDRVEHDGSNYSQALWSGDKDSRRTGTPLSDNMQWHMLPSSGQFGNIDGDANGF
ncbi:hypothetical protein K488DRAFT_85508 [Vararia minispora EC-137]|uniref:Uncharacterized protein n=1 Tax=Vararia minispora EC-137 TaxID=1314806 RepID=A0ACB8QM49_9AGAM|nr:hypothetical protein K488DRAFT_85508 [Vararia minispora EC-137]